MTAAKVMDMMSRLPGCSGQAADAVSAQTQNARRINVIKKSRVRMSRDMDTSTRSTNGQNHGPVWKTQPFLSKGLCTVIECVWEIRYRIITKTILQEKVRIHYSTTIWSINLFLCLKL